MKANVAAILFSVVLVGIISTVVLAEEKFGVKIYPGAVLDVKMTKSLNGPGNSSEMALYTTKDDITKVFDFYKKQPALKQMGTGLTTQEGGRRGAMFTGNKIMLTIERPYLDMTTAKFDEKKGVTGTLINATLISIGKEKK